MVSSYTPNKRLEKPANGDYVDTWQVPVNGDMDVLDQALGGTTFLNATGGSAVLTVADYRAMAISISGAMSGNVTYTIPAGVGGCWIVYNGTTDSVGTGPWAITFASGGGGTTLTIRRGFNTTIYSDGTNIRLADNSATAGGVNTNIQYNESNSFAGSNNFVYDYNNIRVGIGISSPAVRLQVVGGRTSLSAANEAFALQLNNGATLNGPFLGSPGADIFTVSSSAGTERMRLDASGNLGIGASPGYRLDVIQNNPTRGILAQLGNTAASGQTGSQLTFLQNNINYWTIGQPAGTNAFSFWQGRWSGGDGSEVARIDATGSLGLGGATPTQRLTLGGAGDQYINRSIETGATVVSGGASISSGAFVARGVSSSYNPAGVEIYTGSTPRVFINSGGAVGIGTTSPSQLLTVAGAIYSTTGGFVFPDGSVQTSATFVRTVNAGQGISLNSTTGNVTISVPNGGINAAMLQGGVAVANIGYQPVNKGGDSMSGTLEVPALSITSGSPTINLNDTNWGTRYIHNNDGLVGFLTSGGGWAMYVDNGGNLVSIGNVTAYSDIALKKDLVHVHDALEIVKSLNGYRYTRIDTGQKEVGLVAQEVEAMLPELVMQGKEYKSLAYDRMVAVLVEAVKTLSARVELLEKGYAHTV